MNWLAFFGVVGVVAAFILVLVLLSLAADYDTPVEMRVVFIVIAVLFVATLIGIGTHMAERQDQQRRCQQIGQC